MRVARLQSNAALKGTIPHEMLLQPTISNQRKGNRNLMRYLLIAFILCCAYCSAQTTNGAVTASKTGAAEVQPAASSAVLRGKVSDSTGAFLGGATVTIRNAVGGSVSTATDTEGNFILRDLPPGSYTITVTAPGFAEYDIQGFNVVAWEGNNLEIQLHPAGEVTEVKVAAESAMQIETAKSELAGTITQEQVVTIGLNGRNFAQTLTLTPGVSNQTQQDEAKVGVVGSAKYSVNGGRVEYNTFDVDGSDVLNTGIAASHGHPTLSVYPSLDAISEIKVLTSNYGAEYGRSASGTILVTTKSGGQSFHGVGYEFLRNEKLNARGFKDPAGPAPLYRRQDFGFTLGGPLFIARRYNVKKDKTFFFFSEEFRLEQTPTSFAQAVPSLNEREGNFSDVCPVAGGASYKLTKYPDCPASDHNGGDDEPIIPIDPNANAILHTNLIPIANSSTGCSYSLSLSPTSDPSTWPCYDITVSPSTYWREELFRIDHNLNPSVKASFRYIHDDWDTTTTTPQWQYGGNANSFPTVMNRFVGPGLSMVAHLTTFKSSSSLVNDYSFSFVTQHITLADVSGPGADLTRPSQLDAGCGALISSCGIGYIFPGSGGKIPGINLGGSNAAYGGAGFLADTSYMSWRNANPTITLRDDLSKQIGKHLLQAGVLFVDAQQSELSSATGANTGNVQGFVTFSNVSNPNTTYNAFADFLLINTIDNSNTPTPGNPLGPTYSKGGIVNYQQDSAQSLYANKYSVIEPYFQDDWHILPRLTLNFGLRFSMFGNWTPNGSSVYNFVPGKFDTTMANTLQVDPTYGFVKNASTGAAILANAQNPDPSTINGLVKCGTDGVPASCMGSHYFNPSPRIGFAWDPTGKGNTSLRAGYGIFYEHGTGDEANSGSLTGSAPLVQSMTQNAPQGNEFRWECIGGVAPGCNGTIPAGAAYPLDISAIPTQAVWPYVQQWSLSAQQQLGKDTVATVAYVGSKGTHLATVRQLNQFDPVPAEDNYFGPHEPLLSVSDTSGSGLVAQCVSPFTTANGYRYYPSNPAYQNLEVACTTGINPNSLRKYLGYGRILSVENTVNSSYNAMQITMHHVRGPWDLGLSYSYGHSIDEASDRFESALGNSLDPSSNRASSDFDERHIFNLSYVYKLPIPHLMQIMVDQGKCNDDDEDCRKAHPRGSANPSAYLIKALGGWELSGLTLFQSGSPFTVINGGSSTVSALDNAGVANGLGTGSYPDVVKPQGVCYDYSVSNGTSLVLGPLLRSRCQFVAPRGLTFGNAGRNYMNNPGRLNTDVALHRHFTTLYKSHLEVRAEAFNLFNHTQYRIYDPEKGNTPSNTISCYGNNADGFSAGATSCNPGNSFLHPVDAHRPRTVQLGVKLDF
jgi:hypothetical protein